MLQGVSASAPFVRQTHIPPCRRAQLVPGKRLPAACISLEWMCHTGLACPAPRLPLSTSSTKRINLASRSFPQWYPLSGTAATIAPREEAPDGEVNPRTKIVNLPPDFKCLNYLKATMHLNT
jgi:hypothetical protein